MTYEQIDLAGPVRLVGEAGHVHAARRLREAFPGIAWQDGGDGPAVTLLDDTTLPEGAFRLEATPQGVTVSGGPFSGVIYGTEELIARAGTDAARLALPAGVIEEQPGLVYRTFWTWDHSTNWELSQVGQQEIGVFNPYGKPPDGFLADYRRVVDFCSRNRIAAVVIYGFLRDTHGGVEAEGRQRSSGRGVDDARGCKAVGRLELLECGGRARTEDSVGAAADVDPGRQQLLLEEQDRFAAHALRQTEHGAGRQSEFERSRIVDDTGRGQAVLRLELLEGCFGSGSEDAIDTAGDLDALTDESLLNGPDGIALGATRQTGHRRRRGLRTQRPRPGEHRRQ